MYGMPIGHSPSCLHYPVPKAPAFRFAAPCCPRVRRIVPPRFEGETVQVTAVRAFAIRRLSWVSARTRYLVDELTSDYLLLGVLRIGQEPVKKPILSV